MDVQAYLAANRGKNPGWQRQAPRIHCADGFSLSVQASDFHYCVPRDNAGPWAMVEIGYPSADPELIAEYAEDPGALTDTVYSCVPVALVDELIALHGGIANPDGSQPEEA
jgi:hypothetical protein